MHLGFIEHNLVNNITVTGFRYSMGILLEKPPHPENIWKNWACISENIVPLWRLLDTKANKPTKQTVKSFEVIITINCKQNIQVRSERGEGENSGQLLAVRINTGWNGRVRGDQSVGTFSSPSPPTLSINSLWDI